MLKVTAIETTRTKPRTMALLSFGVPVFSFAIIALGIETLVCAQYVSSALGPQYKIIPVLPFLPAIPWLACLFGTIISACGLGFLFKSTVRGASMSLGILLFLCSLVLEVPKNAADPASMSLRTQVFESLALACLAWLLPGCDSVPGWLVRSSRYLLALSLIVFGVDHFLGLVPIGMLIPNWIPWHVFWIAVFGAGFIASGFSIALNLLLRSGAALIGLMFAIWVFTLHLPRVLGLYSIPGAPSNPAEWSSLFIAIAIWGGSWALADGAAPPSQELKVSIAPEAPYLP